MGYTLKAYIGRKESLTPILEKYTESKLVELNSDISMIPLTEELFDEINQMEISTKLMGFEFLNQNIENRILKVIGSKEVAYVESEFFGGEGGHIGLIWKNGERAFTSDLNIQSMNEILKRLGVQKTTFKDEFDSIGLGQYRQTEDWIQ